MLERYQNSILELELHQWYLFFFIGNILAREFSMELLGPLTKIWTPDPVLPSDEAGDIKNTDRHQPLTLKEPTKIKQIESFLWIHEILKSQLQNMTLASFRLEIGSQKISEEKDSPPVTVKSILDQIATVLKIVLISEGHKDDEIRNLASKINSLLHSRILGALEKSPEINTADKQMFKKIFDGLKDLITEPAKMEHPHKCMISTLKWVDSLLEYFPEQLSSLSDHVIGNLRSPDQKIVETSVILIAKCVEKRNQVSLLDLLISSIEGIFSPLKPNLRQPTTGTH